MLREDRLNNHMVDMRQELQCSDAELGEEVEMLIEEWLNKVRVRVGVGVRVRVGVRV
jgi:hypothetical protein